MASGLDILLAVEANDFSSVAVHSRKNSSVLSGYRKMSGFQSETRTALLCPDRVLRFKRKRGRRPAISDQAVELLATTELEMATELDDRTERLQKYLTRLPPNSAA